jgi:hypothetical protein
MPIKKGRILFKGLGHLRLFMTLYRNEYPLFPQEDVRGQLEGPNPTRKSLESRRRRPQIEMAVRETIVLTSEHLTVGCLRET